MRSSLTMHDIMCCPSHAPSDKGHAWLPSVYAGNDNGSSPVLLQ